MKTIATLTSKSQITVPKGVRKALGLQEGDGIEFTMEQGRVVVRAVKPNRSSSGALQQFLSRRFRAPTVEEMDRGIERHLARKHKRSR